MTYKNIKTGELVKYEFNLGKYIVFTKDWDTYYLLQNEFHKKYKPIIKLTK